jgi:hypothetical protein
MITASEAASKSYAVKHGNIDSHKQLKEIFEEIELSSSSGERFIKIRFLSPYNINVLKNELGYSVSDASLDDYYTIYW